MPQIAFEDLLACDHSSSLLAAAGLRSYLFLFYAAEARAKSVDQ